jgi:hypothetical protein
MLVVLIERAGYGFGLSYNESRVYDKDWCEYLNGKLTLVYWSPRAVASTTASAI